jgi:hypothetical protein
MEDPRPHELGSLYGREVVPLAMIDFGAGKYRLAISTVSQAEADETQRTSAGTALILQGPTNVPTLPSRPAECRYRRSEPDALRLAYHKTSQRAHHDQDRSKQRSLDANVVCAV